MSTPSHTPTITYSRAAAQVPETDMYLDNLHARLVSGHNSVEDLLDHETWQHIAQSPVAIDIEAAGLGADAFDMRCVTAAWWTPTAAQSISTVTGVLLDPRDPQQANYIRRILAEAPTLVFHNATYDVPPLYQHGLITLDQIHKIVDTLVMARMAYTLKETDKSLEALATRDDLIALIPGGGSMSLAFKAHGYSRADQGWAGMDIDQLPYRLGAMTDTVATLRLMQPLYDKCVHWLTSSPFEGSTVPRTPADAHYLIDREQTVNRAMMRRSAIGLRVDRDYLHTYQAQTQQEREESAQLITDTLGEASVGNGAHVVEYLDKQGLLPPTYPRTPTGKLKADKEAFASLPDHPLIQAHRAVADTDHILDYLSKVDAMATITGRVHPQVGVLGASATGRMAYKIPEFQQFPALARPIVVWDEPAGAMSLDWSSIEPVTMANCAGDHDFLHGFNTDPTTDLYDPIVKGEGIERKLAKKVMLATMYGQGVRRLAAELGITEDEARTAKKRVFAPMPATLSFMENIQRTGSDYGVIMTADGRMQSIPKDPADKYMGYKAVNYFCITPETPILTADLRHVRADAVKVGDELVGFDEYAKESKGRGTGKRFFRTAKVTDTAVVMKDSVRVVTSDGKFTECSADHKWLVRCPGKQPRLQWVEAQNLTQEHQLMSLGVWEEDKGRTAGYLAGLYDGEGSLAKREPSRTRATLFFSQNEGKVMDVFLEGMKELGLEHSHMKRSPNSTSTCDTVRVTGLAKVMRTLGTLRPNRFIGRAKEVFDGAEIHTSRMMEGTPEVLDVIPIGKKKCISITTDTHTLVANGYLSHNCQGSAYSVLSEVVASCYRAGISDHIYLAMHDELVVDASVADQVRHMMQTPPEWLVEFAGRTPVLRTDANPLPDCWLYV